jgi:hypothetical protein
MTSHRLGPVLGAMTLAFLLVSMTTGRVEFRAEFFNILNHPDFAPPNTNGFSGNQADLSPFSEKPGESFGKITVQQNIPRQIQLALRIEF